MDSDSERTVRVELYVRSELPPPARAQADAVEGQLEEFVQRGVLASAVREEWDKRVPVDTCECRVRDTYLCFRAWAEEQDLRVFPFFETRECYSPRQGGMTDWLVVPALCLAIYEDGDLRAVYPHADATDTLTIEDGVQTLREDLLGVPDESAALAN